MFQSCVQATENHSHFLTRRLTKNEIPKAAFILPIQDPTVYIDTNRVEDHANRVEDHTNRVEDHANRVEDHANRVEDHTNRVKDHAKTKLKETDVNHAEWKSKAQKGKKESDADKDADKDADAGQDYGKPCKQDFRPAAPLPPQMVLPVNDLYIRKVRLQIN